ncbi:unnamed protein product [Lactuca virosa]|uniref:No apical meristem-associated C-terminal domain-containing protein n=1 Tax=Lactuca virosa TaxID=75947 RepID=A0AAU9NS91_9ASTR|nr:unnamed protein product [Lactuca virosa]
MSIVTGVAGSSSQGAINEQTDMANPLADLAGILCHQARGPGDELPTPQTVLRSGGRDGFEEYYFEGADAQTTFRLPQTPHTPRPPNTPPTPHGSTSRGVTGGHDSNASDFQESSLPLISRKGKKFGSRKIHSTCISLYWENMDHLWPRFSDIPYEALLQMWNSLKNSNIFDAFKCVLKDRYRDRMKHIRIKSREMARNDGKPDPLDKWRKNSKIALQNRKVADANGSTARHTAGSIGFDEHRNNLEKIMGKPPTQFDCSLTAKEAQESYLQEMVKKHEEDSSNHKDDARVWEEIQLRRKRKEEG